MEGDVIYIYNMYSYNVLHKRVRHTSKLDTFAKPLLNPLLLTVNYYASTYTRAISLKRGLNTARS
jgi:hypothetical protein